MFQRLIDKKFKVILCTQFADISKNLSKMF